MEEVIRTTVLVLGFVIMALGAWHLRIYGKDILLPRLGLYLCGAALCIASGFKNPEFYIAGSVAIMIAWAIWAIRAPIVVRSGMNQLQPVTLDSLFD